MARILGIDPGSRVTGYGIIESNGSHSRHIASGCIRTQQKAFTERLGEIFLGLQQIIEEHQPDQVAIEEVFVDKNVSSALKLGQARGAAIAAAVVAQKPVFEYTPRLVKKALVGKGQAEKEQVQHMVKVLLSLQGKFGLDESDALAIALCHAHSHTTLSSIGEMMIGLLRGRVLHKQPPFLLLDVNGVGYELEAPMSTFYALPLGDEEITLYTHLTVREDAHILYGFSAESDRALFRALLKVNGVGGKMALGILSGMTADEFAMTVSAGDVAAMTKIPGVGKKTAERLIIEMRDRMDKLGSSSSTPLLGGKALSGGAANPLDDAMSALMALGYKAADVQRMTKNVETDGLSTEEIIRQALQSTR